jgi:hypothetical protein
MSGARIGVVVAALAMGCGAEGSEGASSSEGGGGAEPIAYGSQDPNAEEILNGTCAPHGQHFSSVYSCETVTGPTPSEPPGADPAVSHDPETLTDPDYDWVLAELEACSCICCHANDGVATYVWSSSFLPAWSDSADEQVLSKLGRYGAPVVMTIPLEDNNGFTNEQTGHPTTDPKRFGAFVDRELTRRGF